MNLRLNKILFQYSAKIVLIGLFTVSCSGLKQDKLSSEHCANCKDLATRNLSSINEIQKTQRCFIDANINCDQTLNRSLLSEEAQFRLKIWDSRILSKRLALYNSSEVQTHQSACVDFGRLLKTECLIPSPVTSVFYDESGNLSRTDIIVGFDADMPSKAENYPTPFQAYFKNCDENGKKGLHFENGFCVKNGTHLDPIQPDLARPQSNYKVCTDSPKSNNVVKQAYLWDYERKAYDETQCAPIECRSPYQVVLNPKHQFSCKILTKLYMKSPGPIYSPTSSNKKYCYYQADADIVPAKKVLRVFLNKQAYQGMWDRCYANFYIDDLSKLESTNSKNITSIDLVTPKYWTPRSGAIQYVADYISYIPSSFVGTDSVPRLCQADPGTYCPEAFGSPQLCPSNSYCLGGNISVKPISCETGKKSKDATKGPCQK